MATLLTEEHVHELVAAPKRLVRNAELAWKPPEPPNGNSAGGRLANHHRIMRPRISLLPRRCRKGGS
jgi:hypothetical protein